tara:strand:- start:437 stop:931 length:495 start_codon:yes stop_codon:yes gene_type:complete
MKRLDNENTTGESPKNDSISEAEIIAFSANLISCLEEKKKQFNKQNKSNLKINQLKEIYQRGMSFQKDDLNLHGLARVNMFLRQEAFNKENPKEDSSLTVDSLVFEQSEASSELEFDISENWKPSEEDYESAKADEKKFDLNLKISSFEELYIEEYKPLDFNWE